MRHVTSNCTEQPIITETPVTLAELSHRVVQGDEEIDDVVVEYEDLTREKVESGLAYIAYHQDEIESWMDAWRQLDPVEWVVTPPSENATLRCDVRGYSVGDQETVQFGGSSYEVMVVDAVGDVCTAEVLLEYTDCESPTV